MQLKSITKRNKFELKFCVKFIPGLDSRFVMYFTLSSIVLSFKIPYKVNIASSSIYWQTTAAADLYFIFSRQRIK